MQITKSIEWDMGHRIPNHKSKCKNPHGHRYHLEVTVEGNLNTKTGASNQGMVVDFSDLKLILQQYIHDVCDHGFMYWQQDTQMSQLFSANPDFKSICVDFIPTAECISQWIYSLLKTELKKKYKNILSLKKVQLWETPTSSATISE